MWVYLYKNNTENELSNAYIGIPNPESITLDKSSISLTTIGQTEQLTATIEPTISDHSITWTTSDSTIATVSPTWLVTCVTPWTATITATTSNGLTASCGVKQSGLPNTYQEVEWIGSSWTQYIETDYVTTMDSEFTAEISWSSSQTWWAVFFGSDYNDQANRSIVCRIYDNSATTYNPLFFNSSYSAVQISTTTDVFHTIVIHKNWWTFDWTPYTLNTNWSVNSYPIDIFARNTSWTRGDRKSIMKFKSLEIKENWTTVRNYVPCYRKQDWVIGLYELVDGVFHTNAWSWTFSKWSDV